MSRRPPLPRTPGGIGKARRKTVELSKERLVRETSLPGEGWTPLVFEPGVDGVSLVEWAQEERERLERLLLEHGAILFRGFGIRSLDAFREVMGATSDDALLEYRYRSTPRSQIEGRVYSSTEYPAARSIPMHNEMSYARSWPSRIWFYCDTAAEEGGETPLADSRRVYRRLDADLRERFEGRGVMYVRNYGEGMDLSWTDVFQTDEREEVERFCRDQGIEVAWKEGGRLRTRQVCQAVIDHPVTGEPVWFNQAHLFHVSALEESVRRMLLDSFAPDELPRNAFFGDGSPIPEEDLEHIRTVYAEESVAFPWREGDVLMVDNVLTAHGRRPFGGERLILVGMAGEQTAA